MKQLQIPSRETRDYLSAANLRNILLLLLIVYLPVIGLLFILAVQNAIPLDTFTRDTADVAKAPLFTGLISNLGILMWTATGSICIFTGVLLRRSNNRIAHFLLASGLLTLVLMFDDLLLMHERVFDEHLGIPEELVIGSYGLALAGILLWWRRVIWESNYMLLILALFFFAISVGADIGQSQLFDSGVATSETGFNELQILIEDGMKLLGIVTWLVYFANLSLQQLQSVFNHRQPA